MNCNEAVDALIASIETGSLTDEQREHLRTCARCREMLDSAKQFETMLDDERPREPELEPAVVEDVVRREYAKSVVWKLVIGVFVVALAGAFLVWRSGFGGFGAPELVVVGVLAILPFVIVYAVIRGIARRHDGKHLYKRLKPGRQLSGVCLGIAEATGVSVTLIRLVFFVLFFTNGIGFWLYILLDLAMPVHPADREYLWRFKAKRWLAWIRSR